MRDEKLGFKRLLVLGKVVVFQGPIFNVNSTLFETPRLGLMVSQNTLWVPAQNIHKAPEKGLDRKPNDA